MVLASFAPSVRKAPLERIAASRACGTKHVPVMGTAMAVANVAVTMAGPDPIAARALRGVSEVTARTCAQTTHILGFAVEMEGAEKAGVCAMLGLAALPAVRALKATGSQVATCPALPKKHAREWGAVRRRVNASVSQAGGVAEYVNPYWRLCRLLSNLQ